MTSMQRYRKRIHDQTMSLETDVRCLREEIQKLELQRHLVVSGIPTKTTPFQVVSEYFSLFRYGYKPPMTTSGSSFSDKAHVQKHFLETMFAPDVVLDHGSGISALLENWKMLARHWKDLDIRIKQLEHGEDNQIVATNTGCTIISEEMLKNAFPGLCSIKEHPLVTKLLGQPLAVQCKIFIKWDDSTNRIVGLRHQADPLPALLKLLGSLKIVSAVLNSPLVPPSW
ncbi:hypothetical protein PHMEG_00011944 [Phytophthora megakarya]|uniref:Bzip transcription factor n=1 Tax=Phytophthora megakarya TaxID=4795 RepID=A0A225W9Z9_9STRA|nr:hypothetical protein PHMEG_00011944 [Phytophthora megakarya]